MPAIAIQHRSLLRGESYWIPRSCNWRQCQILSAWMRHGDDPIFRRDLRSSEITLTKLPKIGRLKLRKIAITLIELIPLHHDRKSIGKRFIRLQLGLWCWEWCHVAVDFGTTYTAISYAHDEKMMKVSTSAEIGNIQSDWSKASWHPTD